MKDKIINTAIEILGSVFLLVAICVVCVVCAACIPSEAKESKKNTVRITEYYNEIIGDDAGGIIDFTDPETGVCYFIYKDGYHGMGQGGMTVRYNADGTIMVKEVE